MLRDVRSLSQVIYYAPVPLWVIDPQGLVSLANRAAVQFLGYPGGEDLVGGASHELLHRHRPDGSPYPPHECPIVGAHASQFASESFVTRAGDIRPVQWSTPRIAVGSAMLLSCSEPTPWTHPRGKRRPGYSPCHPGR
jgi:PAS domain S-box-containing protein